MWPQLHYVLRVIWVRDDHCHHSSVRYVHWWDWWRRPILQSQSLLFYYLCWNILSSQFEINVNDSSNDLRTWFIRNRHFGYKTLQHTHYTWMAITVDMGFNSIFPFFPCANCSKFSGSPISFSVFRFRFWKLNDFRAIIIYSKCQHFYCFNGSWKFYVTIVIVSTIN